MQNNKENYICIGAVHMDNFMQIKSIYYRNRTNPITLKQKLGGVAYNIATKIAILDQEVELISLNCDNEIKNKLKNQNIKFKSLNKKIIHRSYTSVINKKGQMLFGLADMDSYEKLIKNIKFNKRNNKIIIFDLNLSSVNIEYLINKYNKNNKIYICGTSAHKIYKIKNQLKKINVLILNKQESFNLTKKNTILDAIIYLIKKNHNLIIAITNGKNTVTAYNNNRIYKCKPKRIDIVNENGAGDTMTAFFIYYLSKKIPFDEILKLSISAGSLHVSGSHFSEKTYLQKINGMAETLKLTFKVYKNDR